MSVVDCYKSYRFTLFDTFAVNYLKFKQIVCLMKPANLTIH